jgi:hypothetical protein
MSFYYSLRIVNDRSFQFDFLRIDVLAASTSSQILHKYIK